MITTVVFDCFGVLCSDGWLPFRNAQFSHDSALLQRAITLDDQTDAGLLKYPDFLVQIAELAGVPYDDVKDQIEINVPNTDLFDFIQTNLVGNYKIGLLSNAAENWLEQLFTAKQLSVFDATALSCEIGYTKPSIAAYQSIAEKLAANVTECVLLDDQSGYCEGARQAGMQAVQFVSNEQALTDLRQILSLK